MMREHPDLVALLAGNDSMALGAVAAVKAAGKTGKVQVVGYDNIGAKLVGDHLAKTLKAGDKVGIIEGVSTTFNAQQRTLGYQDAMKAANITVVGVQSGNWEIK